MSRKRIVVIGGTAAGPKAAARAKRLDENADVTLLQKAPNLSMASCGYPYYVAGSVKERDKLLATPAGVVRDPAFFAGAKGVAALTGTEVTAIDRAAHTIAWKRAASGETGHLPYDKLIIATGSSPKIPPIPGRELAGVTTLASLEDADLLREKAKAMPGGRAVIVGGGLIGMETCEALTDAGLAVTVVEALPQILGFLDPELALLVANHAKAKGAAVLTGVGLSEILGANGAVSGVRLADGRELPCSLVVLAIGVAPNVALAKAAGLELGATGGIKIDAHMRTSDPDIYAAGDCVEVTNRLTGQPMLAPYGDLANLEGRVAGENAALGDTATFPGTIGSGICKVFDFAAGSTGLSERRAREAGIDVVSAVNAGSDIPGFMGAKLLVSKIVAEAKTGRILGFSCVGPGNVNRQVAEMAMAILGGLTVDDLAMADLPYAPPYSLAIDHAIASAHILQNKMRGLMRSVGNGEIKARLDAGDRPLLLDVRGPKEFERTRLGLGETLIPVGQLRKRLAELPQDKTTPIVAYCGVSMRAYEAQRMLLAAGYDNVTVMEGGLAAWPFAREK
ncbi:FAD-dependent oxidoreductase [Solidesulfovibrio magneticus]|uniref:Pyridine nucleotide-disulphide oxidoreductase family protein n=1 Tax=Solidesulfovibrio magneticus (strain ATCC 700980 / DSM 13731 / RS-1) TaxID=573370 RepID=C4XU92_SOLM1|nr:FAD-dependent oxidoreductase [Solidesulfovibrio magneticus]BAH76114.1 pyridine nucleotide-disulphide oxidoreductase family protein [Solidesulfovibrio magneticus RS-1]